LIDYLEGHIVYENPRPHVHSRHGYFPGLVQLPSGELLCLFMLAEAFEAPNGTTYISRSQDSGRTWQLQGALYDKRVAGFETTDSMKATLLRDGTLIAMGYRFRRDDPEQAIGIAETGGVLPGDDIVAFSQDDARTWSVPQIIPHSSPELLEISGPCVELRSGDLVAVSEAALDKKPVPKTDDEDAESSSEFLAYVFGIDPPELPQQILRSFVEELRQHEAHLDHQIAAPAVPRRRDAALAEPEPLARLRARRNANPCRAVERRHLEFRAERRLVHRHRHDDVQVVTLALEQWMRVNPDCDVQIAVLAAVAPDVPLPGHAHARLVGQARGRCDRQRLGPRFNLTAAAGRASRLTLTPRPAAVRARLREHHVPARRLDDPAAVAAHATALGDMEPAQALARAAMLLTRDGERVLAAPDGVLEADRDRVV
jgi:hypothetical protein